jgi:hypothetical protein
MLLPGEDGLKEQAAGDSGAPLSFADFIQCFAVYALVCCWTSLETADANFDTTGLAVAIIVLNDFLDGRVDFFNQFSRTVTGT